jgi:hypothetical protein
MAPVTPYSKYLGDREPIATLRETSSRIDALISGWTPVDFERRYAPGKWTASQILLHLTHIEIAIGMRVRMALTTPSYTLQPFDQDLWMQHETAADGRAVGDTYLALSRLNTAMFANLTPEERATPLSHPEQGAISVEWLICMLAGHQVSHLNHFEQIAREAE